MCRVSQEVGSISWKADAVNALATGTEVSDFVASLPINKPLTSCIRTACPKLSTSLEQAVNNL